MHNVRWKPGVRTTTNDRPREGVAERTGRPLQKAGNDQAAGFCCLRTASTIQEPDLLPILELAENVADLVHEGLVLEIAVLDLGELFEEFSLFFG